MPKYIKAAKRRNIRSHMVWLDRFEMSVILDAIDYYENEAKARLERSPDKYTNLLNVREKIALARFGKIRKSDMSAIRSGKRIPEHRTQTRAPKLEKGAQSTDPQQAARSKPA